MAPLTTLAVTSALLASTLTWPSFPSVPPSPTERRLQQLEAQEAARWRTFFAGEEKCAYRWASWKLNPSTGIRSTRKRCPRWAGGELPSPNLSTEVLVDCTRLEVNNDALSRLVDPRLGWKAPEGPDRAMVVALCDSVTNSGKERR